MVWIDRLWAKKAINLLKIFNLFPFRRIWTCILQGVIPKHSIRMYHLWYFNISIYIRNTNHRVILSNYQILLSCFCCADTCQIGYRHDNGICIYICIWIWIVGCLLWIYRGCCWHGIGFDGTPAYIAGPLSMLTIASRLRIHFQTIILIILKKLLQRILGYTYFLSATFFK